MELKTLRASFGRLDGAELKLKPGLNVIEAPNESGKSTWAAFLRAMLYGVSTSERAKGGSLPDRVRFQPWSGAPMAGTAELRWKDRDVTLRRASPGGGKPMGAAEAVYTGTEERVSELSAGVPGETLLGVPEAVFRRSAFISGADLALDANAELEKKITRLVTSGEERSSYSEADERLRHWQRKRRWRSGGEIPALEQERMDLEAKLRRIEGENKRLSELREQKEKLTQQEALLRNELALHLRDERRREALRRAAAEEAWREARQRQAEAEDRLLTLETRAVAITDEKVRTLRAASVRLEEAARDRDDAVRAREEANSALDALPPETKGPNPRKGAVLLLFLLGVAALLAGSAAGLGYLVLPLGAVYGIFLLGLLLLLGAALLSASGRRILREEQARQTLEKEKRTQALETAEALLASCQEETEGWEEARRRALADLGQGEDEDAETAAREAEDLLRELREAGLLAESARELAEKLDPGEEAPTEPIPEDELPGETKLDKATAEDYLRRTQEKLRAVSRDLDRGEGIFELLGDPLLLATEEAKLRSEEDRLQEEVDAIELASEALREANTRLQTLFSPLISRRAAALMARMTDAAYSGVYFDREMRFSAQRSGDLDAHALEYLSEGTRSQLYLAVRLAICELVLPGDEPCPLILDDVLATFDDLRAKNTLRLLRELSENRQILLLTCQSREARLLDELEKEAQACRLP